MKVVKYISLHCTKATIPNSTSSASSHSSPISSPASSHSNSPKLWSLDPKMEC